MVARDIDAEWAPSELISKTVLDAAEAAGLGVIIARIGGPHRGGTLRRRRGRYDACRHFLFGSIRAQASGEPGVIAFARDVTERAPPRN